MKILGLDYGTKRVGVAIADSIAPVAVPRDVFTNDSELDKKISIFCHEKGIEKIVVGLPVTLRGEEGSMAEAARAFGARVAAATGLPVEFIDERFTTKDLPTEGVQSKDAAAAANILQLWLDRRLRQTNNQQPTTNDSEW